MIYDNLVRPFVDNDFLRRSLIAAVLVSAVCAVAGTFVVLRGLAFAGDALAHGVVPESPLPCWPGSPASSEQQSERQR